MKNKAIFFLLSKMILLTGVCYLLFSQLSRLKTNDWRNIEIKHPNLILLSCSLIFFNWGFEWLKWKNTIRIIVPSSTLKTNFLAFMAGIATGLITPNMLGNFLGRIYYYKKEFRSSIVSMTLLANFSQFFASIFFGLISLLFLKETPWGINLSFINYLLLLFCSSMLAFYFFFEKLRWKFLLRKTNFIEIHSLLRVDGNYRLKILVLSIFRHGIFTLQFWLMFNAFEDAYNFDTFLWIWQIFLWTTLVPSLWFGKLIIRESIALLVLGSIGFGQVEILTSSILIWLVNLAFPALISIFICKQIKTEVE